MNIIMYYVFKGRFYDLECVYMLGFTNSSSYEKIKKIQEKDVKKLFTRKCF